LQPKSSRESRKKADTCQGKWWPVLIYGVEVRQVGIVFKDDARKFHCSPDGLIVGSDNPLEMKNPMAKTHIRSLFDDKVPTDYFGQCQMTLLVTESDKLYFMSNSDGLPAFVKEVGRDEPYIAQIENALNSFYDDLCAMVEKIKQKAQ
jgi:predicted phage-related endonuclease